jgi:TonB family protein
VFSQNSTDENTIYVKVDKMPEFPGGQVALVKYLSKNIKYPSKYKKDKVNGRVFVSFVVDKTGKVGHAKVVKSLNEECDKEAIRVISMMPNWIPGEKDGSKVNVQFGLPVNFE